MRTARTKVIPTCSGVADLKFTGFSGPVDYTIEGEPARLKPGIARLKGSIRTSPDTALAAFRAGEGVLHLDTGEFLRLIMLGHTGGGDQVFVEIRA
jgi:hypothetical protein